jgi:3-oxoacyl-[acyl-carrier protein] reductase
LKCKDKIAIVTGGASGIGLEIAKALVQQGAAVNVIDIDKEKLNDLDDRFVKYNADVTNYGKISEVVNDIFLKHKRVDILVNNAGVIHNELLINITDKDNMKHNYESFKRIIDVNLMSVFIVGVITAEKMVAIRNRGVIVNISSISASGNIGQSAYSAAKAGVEALTRTWSKELGLFGVRAVAISPGFIDTESTDTALSKKYIEDIKNRTPLRCLGDAANIAHAVLFAIENDFVNGTIIGVDGGLVI